MENIKKVVGWYLLFLALVVLNVFVTYFIIRGEEQRLNELRQSNDELMQQNEDMQDAIYAYDLNFKEYQSETDATISDLTEDIEDLKLEKEANEAELHKNDLIEAEIKDGYLGEYELTAYEKTGNPCADGAYPQIGHTVACNDPALWHKWLYIEGVGFRYVHDTGGMPTKSIIDVYLGNYNDCINFGRRTADVYLIE
jgi:3D (Asp-Asp-Asp) domain-containing protein